MGYSYLPVLQVRNDSVLQYLQYQWLNRPPPRYSIQDNLKETGKEAYSGKVTDAAARRLRAVIDVMMQSSRLKMVSRPGGGMFPFRLGFVTLTIPGDIQDVKDVQKVFASFTGWLRYTKTSYVWKAEFQKRGQLHYHLILNRYLPWKEIGHAWNKRMKKAGFLQKWAAEHGHFMPNSVDARSVRMDNGKNMAKYLSKYLAKDLENAKNQKISKWWGCSKNLQVKRFVFEGDYKEHEALRNCERIDSDNWTLYMIKPNTIMSPGTRKNYRKWQKDIRDNI